MPELAASFFVGFLLSLLANSSHFVFVLKSFQNSQILVLQKNLKKVGRIWSMSNRGVLKVPDASPEKIELAMIEDSKRTLRSTVFFSVMLTVVSWFGLIWLALYLLSVHRLAKSRMEHKIFSSRLVSDSNLSGQQVLEMLTEMESYL